MREFQAAGPWNPSSFAVLGHVAMRTISLTSWTARWWESRRSSTTIPINHEHRGFGANPISGTETPTQHARSPESTRGFGTPST